jgi:hypothetical protein
MGDMDEVLERFNGGESLGGGGNAPRKRARYTAEQREKVLSALEEFTGKPASYTATQLNARGLRRANGEEFEPVHVYQLRNEMRERAVRDDDEAEDEDVTEDEGDSEETDEAPPQLFNNDPIGTITAIITDGRLTDAGKVRLVRAYTEELGN